ncbi:hypothetical protein NW754_001549 [Fusarium falciforme]|nr:hypothetical protein NW754_001549 [Fusarium falciforme]
MRPFTQLAIMTQAASLVVADFHLMTRYSNVCEIEGGGGKKDYSPLYPKHVVTWSIGAVPSNQWNCDGFTSPSNFPIVLPQNGEGFGWNGYNYPDICGSGPVDFWEVNGTLEVWIHNANPGQKVATCYRQNGDTIHCGGTCNIQNISDVWVCVDTNLCS